MRKGVESDVGQQAHLDLVDQVRRDLRLQQQLLLRGHHVHQLLPRLHHRPHGLHRQAHHLAIGGRADVDALQILLLGNKLFGIGLHFARHIGQLCFHLFAVLGLPRQLALRQFGHGADGPLHRAIELGNRGLHIGLHAFELHLSVARRVAVFHQIADIGQLVLHDDQLPLALHQHLLGRFALGLQALHALVHALQLGLQRFAARVKQLPLVVHLRQDFRIAHGLQHLGLKRDLLKPSLLGLQAALHRAQAHIALADRLEVGPAHGRIQPHQHLVGLDLVALAHQHLFDNAARQMLHRLALGVDGHRAHGGHALVQRCQAGPQQKAAKAQRQHPQTFAGNALRVGRSAQSVLVARPCHLRIFDLRAQLFG